MAAIPKEYYEEWDNIGKALSKGLHMCSCQRKLKSIVIILFRIRDKCQATKKTELTPEELLIANLLDHNVGLFTHGTNQEYPTPCNHALWDYMDSIKDSPALLDN